MYSDNNLDAYDHQPCAGGFWIEDREDGVALVMTVKGLGAILFRAAYIDGTTKLDFKGVSTFTEVEIGHRK